MKEFKFIEQNQDFGTLESFKTLRTNLMFCGKNVKIIVVTSCSPGDGKSFISKNIAINLANINKKVLFIDADLRKSTLVSNVRFKSQSKLLGLSHFLSGQADLNDVLYHDNVYNLDTIFVGSYPPNPAELLANDLFKILIDKAREVYDYVIIDSPPVGSVIDSVIISNICDGIVMVIKAHHTSYKFARKMKSQLEKSSCKILGTVLNGLEFKKVYRYNKYFYGNDTK